MAGEYGYPKRPAFYSHKFVRVLMKSCAAMEIGPEACLLLCYIAHTEDAAKYTQPVRFWNEQLLSVMAFNHTKQLVRAREKAISSGWLVYWRDNDRAVGKYYVQIPARFASLTDSAMEDDGDLSVTPGPTSNGFSDTGSREPSISVTPGPRNVPQTSQECPRNVPPSIPEPGPGPVPKEEDSSEPSKATASEPPVLTFPTVGTGAKEWHLVQSKIAEWQAAYPSLDVMACCRAALQWCRDNPGRRKTPNGMTRFLNQWLSREQNTQPPPRSRTAGSGGTLRQTGIERFLERHRDGDR